MDALRGKSFAILRIAFGFVWAIDAYLKWQPAFLDNFTGYLTDALAGQPAAIGWWLTAWIQFVSVDPHLFALIVATLETGIALALVFGVFTRVALAGSLALSLVIWVTAEGFGGPYVAGSTDIGAAPIYALLSIALWLGESWRRYGIGARFMR